MCDGVTQGRPGMELSLFSRDTIAMGTAIALSHDVFDAALLLGICDKIVPGLLIGALHFGHLPCVFVPGGPMASGLANTEKTRVREQFALGQVGRDALHGRRGGVVPRPRHLHLLRHRQQQPDAARGDGPARARRRLRPPARRPARRADARGGAPRPRQRGWPQAAAAARRASLPIGRLVDERVDRQRDGRAARHRRLDQPPDPLGRGGALGRHRHRLDRLLRPVARDAAAGARLSERQRRREPVPGRRRARLRHPRAARGRLPARRRRHRRRRRPRRLHPRAGAATPAGSPGATLPAESGDDGDRPAARREPFSERGRAEAARGQLRPRGHQGLVGARRPLDRRGAGARLRFAGGDARAPSPPASSSATSSPSSASRGRAPTACPSCTS